LLARHQDVGTFVSGGSIPAHPARTGELLATLSDNGAELDLKTELLSATLGIPNNSIVTALAITR